MKLWLLRPKGSTNTPNWPWEPWYDKAFGFVVRAETEGEARAFAAADCGDEGRDAWMSYSRSSCEELSQEGDAGVIVQDYASA